MAEQSTAPSTPKCVNCIDLGADISFFEFDDFYRITADLRGLSLADITVSLVPGMLRVVGGRTLAPSEDRDDAGSVFSGSFSYNIGLPEDIDGQEIRGSFANGTLIFTIGRLFSC
jgi:HSP20 family molecular chaperone IbpA